VKPCSKCGETKPLEDFPVYYSAGRTKSGRRGACRACYSVAKASWNKAHPDRSRAATRRRDARRRERGQSRNYYQANRERILERARQRRQQRREARLDYAKRHYRRNKHKYIERNARRRAILHERTPAWLSPEQIAWMQSFYERTPVGHHVDHIVPLKGKDVSGLHVPWNLQYLSADENRRKYNKPVST
jgi:hypothetical protein